MPLAVVAVTGLPRTGKSSLLNQLVRELLGLELPPEHGFKASSGGLNQASAALRAFPTQQSTPIGQDEHIARDGSLKGMAPTR